MRVLTYLAIIAIIACLTPTTVAAQMTLTVDAGGTPVVLALSSDQEETLLLALDDHNNGPVPVPLGNAALSLEEYLVHIVIIRDLLPHYRVDLERQQEQTACQRFLALTPTQQRSLINSLGGASPFIRCVRAGGL